MKENESSLTSLISAFGRAYHSKYDTPKIFDDFIAKDLISQKEFSDISENMIQGIQFFNKDLAQRFQDDPDEILKWITQVQLSPTPLARAAYCEKVILHEVMLGLKQYVILGAGLDTFCLRRPELKNSLEIFEIDYPATQEFKKKKLDDANFKIPGNLHFVPMDFTNKFSYQQLIDEGFENKKTFFSLLGVSYYLTKEENSRLIKDLFTKVPSGSSIVFDFADETLFKEKGMSNRVENMVKMASASGEPMKSCFTYYEIENMLEKSGLLIYEHLSPAAINDLFFNNRTDYLSAFETIHYIHAVKK
ncbi:class I SAM-dependent methyltransferase [Bacillus atrophaeus]|uniref:class I SAM-dependent methyltransferase n=2 Tax=Bacillus atrophaeus TaxID=1452 RepID=UPI002282AD2D|nr:class I SAM-dependent methyltransferase [Bacillus atrophaeus]MCY8487442.1 class I SAM-dependent methyltransferase [Bacillus atrophaeus]MCY8958783.1 class I SAM-dependent methyltransferase [Bacillus atrophaeus]MCY8964358.1 class I SAM-dependent methyltransferase [Bacillus atrophaeus]MCY9436902.1 class I SAM-dependent methyltransferase [Bacillus atrophaeus]MEC0650734.1 class I SAM-dependent methyltransferase [Bacillus atrophaeus]